MATYWDATEHVKGLMAEVLFAEALWRLAPDSVLYAPRHPLVDVGSVELGMEVDVKLARRIVQRISAGEPEECVEWWGAARDEQARAGVTHFALVGLAEDVQLRFEDDPGGTLRFAGKASTEFIYLVPRDVVNGAGPVWLTDGTPGRGLYRHLPIAVAERYAFPTVRREAN